MHSTLSVFRIKPGQAQFSPRKQLMLCHYIDMFVCYRARNHAQSAPEGAGSESSNDAGMGVDSNADIVELPDIHADDCLCGITGGNNSNDYCTSIQTRLVALTICKITIN